MCGIYGIIKSKNNKCVYHFDSFESVNKQLFKKSLKRGSEAAGMMVVDNDQIHIIKSSQNINNFFQSTTYKSLKDIVKENKINVILGQTRMSTHGNVENNSNNQPVISRFNKIVGVHNGLIINYQKLHNHKYQLPDLDTQVLINYLEEKFLKNGDTNQIIIKIFNQSIKEVEGIINLALFLTTSNKILLYSNNGSLHYCEKDGLIYFASEAISLKTISNQTIKQIKNKVTIISVNNKKNNYLIKDLSIKSRYSENKQKKIINNLDKLKKHQIDQKIIDKIPRCTKCILPINTPFIKFDSKGVCNYCTNHQKIQYLGKDKLELILAKHRKNNHNPDCLVAFSGGRDSSYGLHLIKKEYGMNPLAFTYDWGMITDLGRRNQSRILSKLQIEQILVSANINQKRKHIRQNILAWLNKPNLGMIPLFMQGDKQCEYHADQIMRQYQIPLMIYFRGNELEKEEFKAGYCGVTEADPGGVIHDLSTINKLRLLNFYGIQYLKNPKYFNSSLMDVAFGYFSTYLKPHNYLYLWHYLPWSETEIVKTLTKKYNWELSSDTSTSWRIGDGSSAFYNYIYYQVQGFTENDSLRSRQIRENIITRKKALKLVKVENKPQYHNLHWYFDILNLDGDKILTVIDKMEKKYDVRKY